MITIRQEKQKLYFKMNTRQKGTSAKKVRANSTIFWERIEKIEREKLGAVNAQKNRTEDKRNAFRLFLWHNFNVIHNKRKKKKRVTKKLVVSDLIRNWIRTQLKCSLTKKARKIKLKPSDQVKRNPVNQS